MTGGPINLHDLPIESQSNPWSDDRIDAWNSPPPPPAPPRDDAGRFTPPDDAA